MIIRGGENVYPVEIEDVVGGHAAVAEIAVVGEPDPHWGQVVTAVVALRDGHGTPSAAEVKEHCRGRLASYKVPQRVVVVETFPRNPAGKYRQGPAARTPRGGPDLMNSISSLS